MAQIPAPNFRCVKGDTLLWDLPTVTCGNITGFRVFSSQSFSGPYQLLATVTNPAQTSFRNLNGGSNRLYYYLETIANCGAQTSNRSDTLDNEVPSLTPIATVNVIDASTIEVRWRKNPSREVVGYIVYKRQTGGLQPYATITNPDSLRFLDRAANPSKQSEEYQVLAVDACGNTSIFDKSHRSIFLKAAPDRCKREARLSWNLYQNWTNSIAKQEVWVSINGRNPTLFAAIGATDTAFVYQNLRDKFRYNFFVRAVESVSNVSARSNDTAFVGDVVEPVRELYLKSASVANNGYVDLTWRWNEDAKIDTVQILRGQGGGFTSIRGFKPSLPLDIEADFTDTTIKASTLPLSYRIRTIDACKVVRESDITSTIGLEGFAENERRNILRWTPFTGAGAEVLGYQIFRTANGQTQAVGNPIDTSAKREYLDLASPEESQICYRIGARFRYLFPDGSEETGVAYSNSVCLEQFSNVFMPNAFSPGGKNSIFRPVFSFVENINTYEMLIVDRLGQILFRSSNPRTGWDGTKNGENMPQGTYVYLVRVGIAGNRQIEKKGIVLLLR